MLLTDKTKKDFLGWVMGQSNYMNNSNHLIRYENSERGEFLWYGNETDLLKENKFLNALIIEWLDSVDIIIEIHYGYSQLDFNFFKAYINEERTDVNVIGRNEATQQAIIKANEIYNNLKTKQNEK